jgi:hypothetical protein
MVPTLFTVTLVTFWQTLACTAPREQVVGPLTLYPELQEGVQLSPCAKDADLQPPSLPFSGACTVHPLGTQVAEVKVPELQLDKPERVYPELQVGAQMPPCKS